MICCRLDDDDALTTMYTYIHILLMMQVFKFAVYLAVPVSLTALVIFQRDRFQSIIEQKGYVKYPPVESSYSFEDVESKLKEKRGR
jgi:hypothetical protein